MECTYQNPILSYNIEVINEEEMCLSLFSKPEKKKEGEIISSPTVVEEAIDL